MNTRPGVSERDLPALARWVFLAGFMGAGKSSVGPKLSTKLGCGFIDLDQLIEQREQKSVEQIFAESGEIKFRKAESAALKALIEGGSGPQVVGLGGGTLSDQKNLEMIQRAGGWIVFLEAPVEELLRRCQAESKVRPLRKNEVQFRQLYETRLPQYRAAQLRVQTSSKDVEHVAAEVVEKLKLEAKPFKE